MTLGWMTSRSPSAEVVSVRPFSDGEEQADNAAALTVATQNAATRDRFSNVMDVSP
jgi:hypothetical protein